MSVDFLCVSASCLLILANLVNHHNLYIKCIGMSMCMTVAEAKKKKVYISPDIVEKVAEHLKDIMKAYEISLEDAKKAVTVKWGKKWCPAMPSFAQGKATTLCKIRKELSDIASNYGISLEQLLSQISAEDISEEESEIEVGGYE